MSNNIRVTPSTHSTAVNTATDQGGTSVHTPIYKISWGSLGTNTLTDADNPLPVNLAGINDADRLKVEAQVSIESSLLSINNHLFRLEQILLYAYNIDPETDLTIEDKENGT